jgi:hypothetical protein
MYNPHFKGQIMNITTTAPGFRGFLPKFAAFFTIELILSPVKDKRREL